MIFGEDISLNAAAIIQCIIAAIASTVLAVRLQKRFRLNWLGMLCILVSQYGITLLNRFVAQRRYSYFNSIETEGLAYSLWVFFFLALIAIIYDKNMRSIVACLIWSVLLISIRKQMLITLILLFFALIYIWYDNKKIWKTFIYAIIVVAIGFGSARLLDCVYNSATRGVFAPHTGDSYFILGNEIYVADIDMAEYISDEQNKELFIEILKRADEKEYNISYAPTDWSGLENHYSMSYDRIKFDTVMVVLNEYLDSRNLPLEQRENLYQYITNSMAKELLLPCIGDIFKLFLCNIIHGLITTVLKVHPILNWFALMIYIIYITLTIISFRKKAYVTPFAVMVLLAMLVNIGFTATTIYCQMRYMLYNTAFFYQAMLIMVIEAFRSYKEK
jgi:hypothetical protein